MEIGDMVQLRSGGPIMTVVDSYGDGSTARYVCAWFHEGEHSMASFPDEALTMVSPVQPFPQSDP